MVDDNFLSIPVNNGIPSKEESVAAFIVDRYHALRVYKTLTLEEARIESLVKVNFKVRQILLAHFPQEQNYQQKNTLLRIQSHSLSQHQQNIDIQQQPPLPI